MNNNNINKFINNYEVYHHLSGLDILFYNQKAEEFSLFLNINVGSVNINIGEKKIPLGTAHFLEHLLFENNQKDTSLFAKTGSIANAFTDYTRTMYFVSGYDKIEENLKILLNSVINCKINNITLELTCDVIRNEIMLYEKDIFTKLQCNFFKSLFLEHAGQYDIAGTIKSIQRISMEDVILFYNSFYLANNMELIICGKCDRKKIMEIINSFFDNVNNKDLSEYRKKNIYVDNPEQFNGNCNFLYDIFQIGYKYLVSDKENTCEKILNEIYLEIITIIINNTINTFEIIDSNVLIIENFFICSIVGIINENSNIYEEIVEISKNLNYKGIKEEVFIIAKKNIYAKYIRYLNDKNSLNLFLLESYSSKLNIKDIFRYISNLTLKDIINFINLHDYTDTFKAVFLHSSTFRNK